MVRTIEELMYLMSDFFMAPVLILLMILFAYSLYALGAFFTQSAQRRKNQGAFFKATNPKRQGKLDAPIAGYPLASLLANNSHLTKDQLDVAALEDMDGVRTASRLAPMLGLIATMVPMGPALKSLADGNVQGISENLIIAFSAVVFGLVIASITFWIASIKRRWLAVELVALTPLVDELQAQLQEESKAERVTAKALLQAKSESEAKKAEKEGTREAA